MHVNALDGMRALAAVAVLLYHCAPLAPSYLNSFCVSGWSGVDLFFVLSGYLITTILLTNKDSSNYYRVFYGRRALRIFPVYYIALILIFFVLPALRSHSWLLRQLSVSPVSWDKQILFWLNLSNLETAFHPLVVPQLTHFWTLAIEEQFYAVWPFVVRKVRRETLVWICVTGLILGPILRNLTSIQTYNDTHFNFIYRFTPLHIDGLLAGSLLALTFQQGWKRDVLLKAFWACIVAGLLVLSALPVPLHPGSIDATRFGYSALTAIFAGAVGLALLGGNDFWANRILGMPLLRTLGRVSYTFYVVHVIMLNAVWLEMREFFAWFRTPHHELRNFALVAGVTLIFSFLTAEVSWWLIEAPALNLKRFFRYTQSITTPSGPAPSPSYDPLAKSA